MLADPDLGVAQFVGAPDNLKVPLERRSERSFGRRRGHQEKAEFHAVLIQPLTSVGTDPPG
jgi:hypothetical protein